MKLSKREPKHMGEVMSDIAERYDKLTKTKMSKQITLTQEELEKEINQAFTHGQGNGTMMEAGLERDETKDYVNSRMRSLLNQNKEDEW